MTHVKLFIPGPTEVRAEVLQAQTEPMIGHRSAECDALFASLQDKLRQVFLTQHRVYVLAASGSGLQEASVRNGVRNNQRCANFVNGAFGLRWHQVTTGCGKVGIKFEVPWGQPILPAFVEECLAGGRWDAITVVHNETSTGVANPVGEIAALVRERYPNTLIFVDAVSSLGGDFLPVDEWELDVCLTSSQKALAMPPGLAFVAVSDRTLERAEAVPGRGWYFDFLLLEKYLLRSTTPATPAISLLRAAERQLTSILQEGVQTRIARHQRLAEQTQRWVLDHGFGLFAAKGYRSHTVTCGKNTRAIDVIDLNAFLRRRGLVIANGYGELKHQTFRIAHMGDVTDLEMQALLSAIDAYLETIP
jgi:aspartate aminotransferase-like enzyme